MARDQCARLYCQHSPLALVTSAQRKRPQWWTPEDDGKSNLQNEPNMASCNANHYFAKSERDGQSPFGVLHFKRKAHLLLLDSVPMHGIRPTYFS